MWRIAVSIFVASIFVASKFVERERRAHEEGCFVNSG